MEENRRKDIVKEDIYGTSFRNLGLSNLSCIHFERMGFLTLGSFLEYLAARKKIIEEGGWGADRPIRSRPVKELIERLRELDLLWVLGNEE